MRAQQIPIEYGSNIAKVKKWHFRRSQISFMRHKRMNKILKISAIATLIPLRFKNRPWVKKSAKILWSNYQWVILERHLKLLRVRILKRSPWQLITLTSWVRDPKRPTQLKKLIRSKRPISSTRRGIRCKRQIWVCHLSPCIPREPKKCKLAKDLERLFRHLLWKPEIKLIRRLFLKMAPSKVVKCRCLERRLFRQWSKIKWLPQSKKMKFSSPKSKTI